jgi:hypothetical protein
MTTIDLTQITQTADVVIDGHALWVRPGATEAGRYWQFLAPNDVPVGMVVERSGALEPVFDALVTIPAGPSPTVMDAAQLIIAQLCRPGDAS